MMKLKDSMEAEIDELMKVLKPYGMTGGLIDAEGYPLDDVMRIINIREARHRYACLQTDHKQLLKDIEQALYTHLAPPESRSENASSSPSTSSSPTLITSSSNIDSIIPTTNSTTLIPISPTISSSPSSSSSNVHNEPCTCLFTVVSIDPRGLAARELLLNVGDVVFRVGSIRRRAGPPKSQSNLTYGLDQIAKKALSTTLHIRPSHGAPLAEEKVISIPAGFNPSGDQNFFKCFGIEIDWSCSHK